MKKGNWMSLALVLAASGAALAQTVETVGDVDSYGRTPIYLGAKPLPRTALLPICALLPAGTLCAPLDANGAAKTEFKEAAVLTVLANATQSQLCLEFTPTVLYNLNKLPNPTISYVTSGLLFVRARFSNPLLANPNVVNTQGLPFPNGEIVETYPMFRKSVKIPAPAYFSGTDDFTRRCGAQVLSKQRLIGMGLTAAQANLFFKQPTRIAIDIVYDVVGAVSMQSYNHVTLYGDK